MWNLLWRSSVPFRHLQHHYILKLQDILHTCPPSPNILSCVHAPCISTPLNIGHYLHMHYNTLPKPLHICRHTSFHIPSYSRYTMLNLWTSSCMKAHVCQMSGIICTQHAKYLQHLHKCLDTNPFDSLALLTHWYASPNISIVQGHTSVLSPVFILSHQSVIFFPLLLKLSIDFGSVGKHSYSPPPFSEIDRCLVLLVSDLHIFIHTFQITFSEYFWIFVCSCTCSMIVLQSNKFYFTPSSLADNCRAVYYNLHHHLAHYLHLYHSHLQQSKLSYPLHHP